MVMHHHGGRQGLSKGGERRRGDRAPKRCLDTPAFPRPCLESAKGPILGQGCDGVVRNSCGNKLA